MNRPMFNGIIENFNSLNVALLNVKSVNPKAVMLNEISESWLVPVLMARIQRVNTPINIIISVKLKTIFG